MRFIDARGQALILEAPPRRIVSLVPSTTETLFALGAGQQVVGRTRFCVRPADQVADVPIVGGTKDPRIERIRALAPDLVLANAEENRAEDVAALERFSRVFVTFPRTVAQAIADLRTLGAITGQVERAEEIATAIEEELAWLRVLAEDRAPFRFAYLVWRRPYMTINRDTYIHDLLSLGGGINVFADEPERYPRISAREIFGRGPDLIFLPSEPYPFAEEHRDELLEQCDDPNRRPCGIGTIPQGWRRRILLVDGEMFGWHGVRTQEGLRYYGNLLRETSLV
ncbi:MAG: helical backbone metal receptor [Anaerolineae bacterium]